MEYLKTHGGTAMTENPEGKKTLLNKDKPEINRGVELLLRNRREKPNRSKKFQLKFSLFRREFAFSLDIKKK